MNRQSKLFSKFVRGLMVVSLALTANVSNSAEILFQQAVIDPVDGFQSDASVGLINGDDFSVAHVKIESISWWGAYFNQDADDFEVKIFNNLSNYPISGLSGSLSVSSALSDLNQQEYYRYQLDLTNPLELIADNYFLSIQNVGTSDWVWLFGNPGNGNTILKDPDWILKNSGSDMAFSLEGNRIQTVPEPNTLILLFLGCSLLFFTHKGMTNNLQA